MKLYKLTNNITGWVIFVIALITYTLTLEPTVSFWDCGEFISGATKLEVVHPPGAPLFLMIARVFTLFASDSSHVAHAVNFMSGLSSAFGILFLFWIITALARKLIIKKGEEPTTNQIWAVMGAGIVGALSCTFSDTYWFSAVEGEVYALSTMFITLVFWAMLKWESSEDEKHRDKWLVLIAFFFGLSIGVHLMSLLAIPAMSLIYYFKKYPNPSVKGVAVAVVVGFLILMFVYVGLISVFINIVAAFDLFFVNSLGLPFGSGAITFSVLVVIAIIFGLVMSRVMRMPNLQTALLGFCMILIGFSMYVLVVIRADAVPPINMNTPSDVFRLQSYLNREQYGARPLLYGPYFTAQPIGTNVVGSKYTKGDKKYIEVGKKVEYEFKVDEQKLRASGLSPAQIRQLKKANKQTLFPRMGSLEDRHKGAYRAWVGLDKNEYPNFIDNMEFFFEYQLGFMWFRYFMWNFTGREDDIQGRFDNNNGKWISGIPFIDKLIVGPIKQLPDQLKNNKGRNKYYFLPFILGILGLIYQSRRPYDLTVIVTLFLFTGILEIIFFNSPPFEPRERDYTLVGSFVTFTIWIGLGFLFVYDFLKSKIPAKPALALSFLLCLIPPTLMGTQNWDDHDRSNRYTALDFAINYLQSVAPNAILFTQGDNDTYPLWYAQEVEGIRTDVRVINLSLLGVDWYIDQLKYKLNDADPIKLQHRPEDYVGNRRDVTRYAEIDKKVSQSYIELMKIVRYIRDNEQPSRGFLPNYIFPSKKFKITVDSAKVVENKVVPKKLYGKIVKEMRFQVKRNNLLKNDLMTMDIVASNLWERPIYFAVSVSPSSFLGMDNYFQLEGLAYRIVPIEDPTPKQQRGGQQGYVAKDIMYDNVMHKFKWGGIEKKDTIMHTIKSGETLASIAEQYNLYAGEVKRMNPGVEDFSKGKNIKILIPQDIYLDENILRMTMNLRSNFARMIEALLADRRDEQAEKAIDYCLSVLPRQSVPYNIFMVKFPELYYQLGKKEKARAVMKELAKVFEQDYEYYSAVVAQMDKPLGVRDPSAKSHLQRAYAVLLELQRLATANKDEEMLEELKTKIPSREEFMQSNPS